jgi:hypothetical protein
MYLYARCSSRYRRSNIWSILYKGKASVIFKSDSLIINHPIKRTLIYECFRGRYVDHEMSGPCSDTQVLRHVLCVKSYWQILGIFFSVKSSYQEGNKFLRIQLVVVLVLPLFLLVLGWWRVWIRLISYLSLLFQKFSFLDLLRERYSVHPDTYSVSLCHIFLVEGRFDNEDTFSKKGGRFSKYLWEV